MSEPSMTKPGAIDTSTANHPRPDRAGEGAVTQPGIYSAPAADYHGDHLAPEPSLSASMIRLLLEASPLHAWRAHPRLGNCADDTRTAESDCGTAAHAALLAAGGKASHGNIVGAIANRRTHLQFAAQGTAA
ncbi:MAG: hypothetical protein IT509_08435 [Rhodocyclaceae bacterium]|nr:hypothetical protein [Rhodocyclaceae bacterium]